MPVDSFGRARWIEDPCRHQLVVGAADSRVRIAAQDVVVAHGALQRQTAGGPLILRVQRRRHEIADELDGAGIDRRLRQLVGYTVAEPILNERREVVVRLAWIAEATLIADFHVVRARDVRHGGPEVGKRSDLMMLEPSAERIIEPVGQSGNAAGPGGGSGLFENRDHRRIVGAVDAGCVVGIVRHVASPAGFEQHTVGEGGRPGEHPGVPWRIEVQPLRFGRPRRGSAACPVARAVLLRILKVDLVAWRHLPRNARDIVPHAGVVERRSVEVEIDGPLRRVAGVLVEEHAGDGVLGVRLAVRQVEPQAVADDSAAAHRVELPDLDQCRRRPEAGVFQRLGVVAALHAAVGSGEHDGAAERVAAVARDDVQDDAGGFRLAQAARSAQHDFLRAGDVHDGGVRVRTGPPHVEAVRQGSRIGRATAVHGRSAPTCSTGNAAGISDSGHPRNHRLDAGGVPRGRNGRQDVPVDRGLRLRALDVDGRRLAGDRDRFRQGADLQIGVDRRDERAGQLDAFAFHRTETGQRERHRIGARPKIDDSVLAGDVAGDRADSFDEDGAGGFHSNAGQHGARRVLDDAGDGCLSPCGRGNQNQCDGREEDAERRAHVAS